jgi:hypothetical protein
MKKTSRKLNRREVEALRKYILGDGIRLREACRRSGLSMTKLHNMLYHKDEGLTLEDRARIRGEDGSQ